VTLSSKKLAPNCCAGAEAEGVSSFTTLDEIAGDPALTADFDVDEFLRQVREDRELLL